MHDPQNILWGQQAMARGYISQEQARLCLEEATQSADSLLNIALQKSWLNGEQVQEILNLSRTGSLPTQMATPSLAPASQSPQKAFEAPKLGEQLGGYTLTRILGQGAMGIVYGAEQNGNEYALKLVLQDCDPEALIRFEIEAQSLAAVDRHPNIVRIHKYERVADHSFFILDLIDGESLDRRLVSGAITNDDYYMSIVEKMASALDHIHKNDIIHRDLKSANILVRKEDGEPFLSDFGLVKRLDFATMTNEGETLGTPHTMSPEQIQGLTLDPRSDLWSLGVVLYEMATGRLPFQSEKVVDLGRQIVEDDPALPQSINPDIPDDVQSIILSCLEKDLDQRYPSAATLQEDCRAYLAGDQLLFAQSTPSSSMLRRTVKGIIILALLCLPFAAYGFLQFQTASQWKRRTTLNLVEINQIAEEMESKETELYGAYFFQETGLEFPKTVNWTVYTSRCSDLVQLMTNLDKLVAEANEQGLEASKKQLLNSESQRKSLKLAVCCRALEQLRQSKGAKLSGNEQKTIPKSFRPIALGYQAVILENWDEARTRFDKAKSKGGRIAQLGTLGAAIIDLKLKKWNSLRYHCEKLLEKNSMLSVYAL
ncbi:MAG: serine/threonine-protein kinase, partial [Planctomycetota bacterium]|nr:serine/threonine-protein kinase [Planctomycetota bacterium]